MTGDPDVVHGRPGPRRPPGSPSGPEEVRRAVLDSAAKLFARRGVADVSLRDIAGDADVHVALITRYFGTRASLIQAVFDDLAGSIAEHTTGQPLQQHSFDPDSPLGRWMAILAHWMLTGQDPAIALGGINPVQAMADVIVAHNGLPERDARIRATQIFGSALGWRLFEPYLIAAGSLDDEKPTRLHDSLTAVHQQVGATPLDPATGSTR